MKVVTDTFVTAAKQDLATYGIVQPATFHTWLRSDADPTGVVAFIDACVEGTIPAPWLGYAFEVVNTVHLQVRSQRRHEAALQEYVHILKRHSWALECLGEVERTRAAARREQPSLRPLNNVE